MGGRRRRGLADLIGEEAAASQQREGGQTREGAAPGVRERVVEKQPGNGGEAVVEPAWGRGREEASVAATRVPKYLALQRKEARLRGDQADALASLARRMNRGKVEKGAERITENTLIRVAVDWLLSQEEIIGASSEEEIRRGLGVPEPPSAGRI